MPDWVTRFRVGGSNEPHLPSDATEATHWLELGNQRFAADAKAADVCTATPPAQTPFGVVLGCSDARAPLELVFDAAPNQLFVVRVAGNVLGDECLGSIEYALVNFRESLRVLVVLGHTGCGAVTAAVDTYLRPKHHAGIAFSRSLRAVVNHILIAVRGAAISLEQTRGRAVADDPGFRNALIELTVPLNAAVTAYQLRQELRPEDAGVAVAYGVYDLATCRVGGAGQEAFGLTPAPTTPDELVDLGVALAASPRVGRHLTPTE